MKKLSIIFISMVFAVSLEAKTLRGIIIVTTGWSGAGVGKVVDYLADKADIIVRALSGSAKGHRVVKRMGDGFNLVLLPSGIIRKNTQCYLTAGVELDPDILFSEIDLLVSKNVKIDGRLWISARA